MPVDRQGQQMAARCRAAREAAGLSQGQAAKKLDISRSALTEVEAGNRKISASELVKMTDVYGVNLSWLAGVEEAVGPDDRGQVVLAARELARLKEDDLEAVLRLIRSIRAGRGR